MTQDEKIDKIYDIVIRLEPMVKCHDKTLYGNGRGLKETVTVLALNQENCPARLKETAEKKRLGLAQVMMVIAIIGLIASTIIGTLNLLK